MIANFTEAEALLERIEPWRGTAPAGYHPNYFGAMTALPEAFADHAARFYLAAGADPARALELARANLANRTTAEARALVVEAALAANQPATACEVAAALASGTRAQQFLAWRAFGACGRAAEAAALARRLGI